MDSYSTRYLKIFELFCTSIIGLLEKSLTFITWLKVEKGPTQTCLLISLEKKVTFLFTNNFMICGQLGLQNTKINLHFLFIFRVNQHYIGSVICNRIIFLCMDTSVRGPQDLCQYEKEKFWFPFCATWGLVQICLMPTLSC